METYLYTMLVSLLAILLTVMFALKVGGARGKFDVKAPACTGPDEFNNTFRAHQNTLEMMVLFMPSLWIFAHLVSDLYAGIAGAAFILGRILYFTAYVGDPSKRTIGFMIGFLSIAVMVIWSLIKIIGMMM